MDVVLGRERTQKSQVVKQADVVALLGLLPQEFVGETKSANFRYYEPRCSHGSSLSPAMHGLVAARLGDTEMALRFFRQTAAIDLANTHVATDGGVHIAALGGIWMLAVFGFAGLSLRNDGLTIDPRLPAGWRTLTFRVQWRRRSLRISIDPDRQTVEATVEAGEPVVLFVGGEPNQISSTATVVIPIRTP
jgi:trehalose/maltose hydrolase-like predicted phosphorylase